MNCDKLSKQLIYGTDKITRVQLLKNNIEYSGVYSPTQNWGRIEKNGVLVERLESEIKFSAFNFEKHGYTLWNGYGGNNPIL